MKKIYITLFSLFFVYYAFADSLDFRLTVTPLTNIKLPPYIDPFHYPLPNEKPTDFPVPTVKIGNEFWIIYKNGYNPKVIRYKGTNIENCVRQSDGLMNLTNSTWGKVINPYLLGGMWFDPSDKKLYAPMHCEYTCVYEKIEGNISRQIHLAVSSDTGRTWNYMGPIFIKDNEPDEYYSGDYWDGGDGDFQIFVDEPNGYVYIYTSNDFWPKPGIKKPQFGGARVARCALKDKGAPGKWWKFYNGKWNEPGIGGKASLVNAGRVMYSSYLKKYVSFDMGSGLSVCTDLSKQDWSPIFYIPGNYWLSDPCWAISVANSKKTNVYVFDSVAYIYRYWCYAPGKAFRLNFSKRSITPDTAGYVETGVANPLCAHNLNAIRPYGEPLYDNQDTIISRQVRKVSCTNPETSYTGVWKTQNDSITLKSCGTAKSTVSLTFKGGGIYWRAASCNDCGKADVYLDGRLQKTADFYGDYTPYQFWFEKTGLDTNITHTIKIIVRGDKNPKSKGTTIKHISFEYSAESNQASDGFSGLSGKNNWYYQIWDGTKYSNLDFNIANNNWTKSGDVFAVGPDYQTPDETKDAVRKWVAPHPGTVRIEGLVSVNKAGGDGVLVRILRNESQIWQQRLVTYGKPASHDLTLKVVKGDSIAFCVNKNINSINDKTYWNPVITFIHK